jgi:hypothetical protein
LTDGEDDEVFSTNNGLMCSYIMRQWELAPGQKDSMVFDPYLLDGDFGVLKVASMMNNDPATQAYVVVEVLNETAICPRSIRPDVVKGNAIRAGCNKSFFLTLSQPGQVTLTAYRPDGRRLALLADRQDMSAGSHEFILDRKISQSGLVIIRATGADFRITGKISVP